MCATAVPLAGRIVARRKAALRSPSCRHPRRLLAESDDIRTWQAPALLDWAPRITMKKSRRGRLAARAFRAIQASARAEASCDRHSRRASESQLGRTEGPSPKAT